jgi:hypothetical protein
MIIHTASGATKPLPEDLDPERVAGLDPEGRIVVDDFDARAKGEGFLFALTLCCNASDKGTEHGVVCRGCYSDAEVGDYLWWQPPTSEAPGGFPGLDELVEISPEDDGAPCCPDPGCPGNPCTFPGYAENH